MATEYADERDDGIVTRIDDNVDSGYVVFVEYGGHVERYDFGDDVERTHATDWAIEYFRANCPFLFDPVVESKTTKGL